MAARATQKGIRQSARKMRLVIDNVRGRDINEAYAILRFSKKKAAKQIEKVLRSAVANAEQDSLRENEAFDADAMFVQHATVDEGATLHRWRPAAYGRATPINKRTSTVEIRLAVKEEN
jgi:large subunit ribosomal protein L22